MIGPASAALARYDELLATIPGPDVLLAPLTTQEAVLSSRIEGTRATMGDVLGFEAGGRTISPDREADVREILNYRVAMAGAIADLADLPLCQRVVLSAHRVLLSGVRGAGKSPRDLSPGSELDRAARVFPGRRHLRAHRRRQAPGGHGRLGTIPPRHGSGPARSACHPACRVRGAASVPRRQRSARAHAGPAVSLATRDHSTTGFSTSAPILRSAGTDTTRVFSEFPVKMTGPAGASSFSMP